MAPADRAQLHRRRNIVERQARLDECLGLVCSAELSIVQVRRTDASPGAGESEPPRPAGGSDSLAGLRGSDVGSGSAPSRRSSSHHRTLRHRHAMACCDPVVGDRTQCARERRGKIIRESVDPTVGTQQQILTCHKRSHVCDALDLSLIVGMEPSVHDQHIEDPCDWPVTVRLGPHREEDQLTDARVHRAEPFRNDITDLRIGALLGVLRRRRARIEHGEAGSPPLQLFSGRLKLNERRIASLLCASDVLGDCAGIRSEVGHEVSLALRDRYAQVIAS